MRLGLARPTPIVFATLITLVAMFIVTALAVRFTSFGPRAYLFLELDPALVIEEYRVWTLLSYALLHSLQSPGHLVFNAIALFFFGPALEDRWGPRRFITVMVLGALMGGLFVVAAHVLGLGSSRVVGASSITMALVIAWAYTYPHNEIYFFFVLPLRGIHLVYITIAYEILNALSFSSVSAAGHFGGMLIGFCYGESSPLRRFYLQARLRRLKAQSESLRGGAPKPRTGGPPLRLIHGGQKEPPKDKRYLN